jgi:ribonuclease III
VSEQARRHEQARDEGACSPEADIGHAFGDRSLLELALTHASFAHERGGPDQERLEFLGDAVLQLGVTEWLYERFPGAREGELSRLRQRLVSTGCLASLGLRIRLGRHLRLGAGEDATGGRDRPRVLAGAVEAVLGAIYLDAGLEAAREVLRAWLGEAVEALAAGAPSEFKDPRSLLQEIEQARRSETPTYHVTDTSGPAHAPWFAVEVRCGDRRLGRGEGPSKREAGRLAALAALAEADSASSEDQSPPLCEDLAPFAEPEPIEEAQAPLEIEEAP